MRLGIGFCRYKLGQFEKARQAFQRVLQANLHQWFTYVDVIFVSHLIYSFTPWNLQLDPDNVEALVALGVMDLQTNEGELSVLQ